MYLNILSILKGLFAFWSHGLNQQTRAITDNQPEDHSYIRGNIFDRGPCPGLNALANQGYL
jgi:hypothetical protein